MHFRQHVDQKLRLRPVMWRVAVDLEKISQTINQVVNRRRVIRASVAATPLIEKQTVALILLERRRVEHANHVVVHAHGIDPLDRLTSSSPIQSIDILQHSENLCFGNALCTI